MQQMAGNMGLLNPFVLNQFSVPSGYSPYSQVQNILKIDHNSLPSILTCLALFLPCSPPANPLSSPPPLQAKWVRPWVRWGRPWVKLLSQFPHLALICPLHSLATSSLLRRRWEF